MSERHKCDKCGAYYPLALMYCIKNEHSNTGLCEYCGPYGGTQ